LGDGPALCDRIDVLAVAGISLTRELVAVVAT
jgi:hypothetical protein